MQSCRALFLTWLLFTAISSSAAINATASFENGVTGTPAGANSLSIQPAKSGDQTRQLSYEFAGSAAGSTVGLNFTLASPAFSVKAVRFHARAPADVRLVLRAVGTQGTADYNVDRSAAARDDLGWITATVLLSSNPNDLGELKQVAILVQKVEGGSPQGVAAFRQIEFWDGPVNDASPSMDRVASLPTPSVVTSDSTSSGVVSFVATHSGDRLLGVNFDFGQALDATYAGVRLQLATAKQARFVRVRLRALQAAEIFVQTEDELGARKEYRLNRSAEAADATGWAAHTVKIDERGPIATNRIGRPISLSAIRIYVKRTDALAAGAFYLRQIDTFDVAPSESAVAYGSAALDWVLSDTAAPGNSVQQLQDADGAYTRLDYDLSATGSASALKTFSVAQRANTLRVLIKAPPGLRLSLRYTDQGASDTQLMDISAIRPYGSLADDSWVAYSFKLDTPEGSDRNRAFSGLVKSLRIRVLRGDDDKYAVANPSGQVLIRDAFLTEEGSQLDLAASTGTQLALGRTDGSDPTRILGVAIPTAYDLEDVQRAFNIGFRYVRVDLTWQTAQNPSGSYNMAAFDPVVNKITSLGMRPVLVLAYNNVRNMCAGLPCDEKSGLAKNQTATYQAYIAYVVEAVKKFKSGAIYEIWNEPNNPDFWKVNPSAPDFADVLRDASQAMRNAAFLEGVTIEIVSGGLARPNLFPYVKTLLGIDAGNALKQLNGFGYHPYHVRDPEWQTSYAAALNASLWKTSGLPSVWITEVGESSALSNGTDGRQAEPRRKQAVNVVRSILGSWAIGSAMHNVYQLRDRNGKLDQYDPHQREHNFGLISADSPPADKPAKLAINQVFAAGKGRTYAGFATGVPSSIQAIKFAGISRETVFIAWASTVGAKGWITVPKTCSPNLTLSGGQAVANPCVSDVIGTSIPLGCTGTQCPAKRCEDLPGTGRMRCPVSESDGPIFIRVAAQ